MTNKDSFVYWENNWDEPNFLGYKYNNDNLIWRYWAAKEMAQLICKEYHPEIVDNTVYIYADDTVFMHKGWLAQVLKKEWFR